MKFSIVTPSFKQEDWLRMAAASVRDQGGPGLEIEHIIQDGNEAQPAAQLRGRVVDENQAGSGGYQLQIHVEKDQGMYDAINRGLARSSGEICAWLNCDEQYLPGTLQKVKDFFERHPEADMVFGDAILVDDRGRALSYRRTVLPGTLHTRLVHLNTLSCATFFRRSIVEKGWLFESRWRAIGDAVWIHRLLKEGVRMALLPEALTVFAFTGENQSASRRAEEEAKEWSGAKDAPPKWLRWPVIVTHRLEKWKAGAYRKRNLDYAIWRPESPQRKKFEARDLGWGWPGSQ